MCALALWCSWFQYLGINGAHKIDSKKNVRWLNCVKRGGGRGKDDCCCFCLSLMNSIWFTRTCCIISLSFQLHSERTCACLCCVSFHEFIVSCTFVRLCVHWCLYSQPIDRWLWTWQKKCCFFPFFITKVYVNFQPLSHAWCDLYIFTIGQFSITLVSVDFFILLSSGNDIHRSEFLLSNMRLILDDTK